MVCRQLGGMVMTKYLIVSRDDYIHRLCFKQGDTGLWICVIFNGSCFYPINGWEYERAAAWLDDRNFLYYWEKDHD